MANFIPLVALENITCEFSGVRALDRVSLTLRAGEIHAITGENGAGKSTLLRVLSGAVAPRSGVIHIAKQSYAHLQNAWGLGIRIIPQEPLVAENLSIAENIYLGRLPRNRARLVDWEATFALGESLLQRVGLAHLDPRRPARGLGVGEQQLIQTARAIAHGGSIFLLDEPTSALSQQEAQKLLSIAAELSQSGAIVAFVSHRMPEIFSLCQRVTVLRDGQVVGEKRITETSPDELIQMMVGRDLPPKLEHRPSALFSKSGIAISGLKLSRRSEPISLQVASGEILGLAGLAGSGRSQILDTLFGLTPSEGCRIEANGEHVFVQSPKRAVSVGIAYVPADRKRDGLVLPMNIEENVALPNLRVFSRMGFLSRAAKREHARQLIMQLGVRCTGTTQATATLSGGNQQKVVFAKWLLRPPRVLLLDEPTRGVDAISRAEIHQKIQDLAAKGMAILLSSSETEELLTLCSRVLVLCDGQLSGELKAGEITEEAILQLAVPGMIIGRRDAC